MENINRPIVRAHQAVGQNPYIKVDAEKSTVTFQIQEGPIKEVGVNGCQASDMLEYVTALFAALNETFPCRENALTITKLEEAQHWQQHRTKDRLQRGVEGRTLA